MRENTGRLGRLSTKITAVVVAIVASLAFANAARAADTVQSEFNDAWIKLPALDALLKGSMHALDPADAAGLKVNLKGDYDAATGKVAYKASEFSFPRQSFDAGAVGTINLDITALQDFNGTYDKNTGALKVDLPLKLTVDAAGLNLKCELRPLNIGLDSAGAPVNFSTEDLPTNNKAGAAFAPPAGTGALIGDWTDVTAANNVYGIATYGKSAEEMTSFCKDTIASFTGGDENQSFDGIIWLGGTTTFTEGQECPAGQEGTYPDCHDIVKPKAVIGSVKVTKATIKAGKKGKIKVTVKNTGDAAFSGKVTLKSSNKQVKVAKSVQIKVAAGKSATKTIVVKTTKKAKGKATITAKVGGKSGKGKVTIKKAKKKRK